MKKIITIELTVDNDEHGVGNMMEHVHEALHGSAPYRDSDMVLCKPSHAPNDPDTGYEGDEFMLYIDFTKKNTSKHHDMVELTNKALTTILNDIETSMGDEKNS